LELIGLGFLSGFPDMFVDGLEKAGDVLVLGTVKVCYLPTLWLLLEGAIVKTSPPGSVGLSELGYLAKIAVCLTGREDPQRTNNWFGFPSRGQHFAPF
jgi:hypothetical protein